MRDERDIIDVPVGRPADDGLMAIGWVSYVLHFVVALAAVVPGAQVSIGLLAVALLIDLVKRADATGTWQASHFSWRIRSVLGAAVLYLVTWPLWLLLLLPGMLAWCLVLLWFLYRIIKGMLRMSEHRPVD